MLEVLRASHQANMMLKYTMHIEVQFTSETEGIILLKDLGFGTMFPGTGKVTVFPFKLIS